MSEKVLFAYQNTKDKSLTPLVKQQEQNYKVYQLIPDRFIQEGKIVEEILTSISALHDFPISIKDKCLHYNPFQPIYYEILYENKKISFQYVIPEMHEQVLTNKIKSVYRTATFIERKDYFSEYQDKYYCLFKQKKHYMFSLNVDYRENGMIEGFLSMINNIQEEDKLLLQIGIIPCDDSWKTQWKNAYLKQKKGDSLEINSSIIGTVLDKTFGFADSLLGVMDMFMGQKPVEKAKQEDKIFEMANFELHRQKRMTMQKVQYQGFQVQIKLFCTNDMRCRYYGKILDGVFKLLDAEQEIELTKMKLNQCAERKFDFQIHKNIFSTKELSTLLQMPNRRMQLEFRNEVHSIETRETPIPKILTKGYVPIGTSTYKGEKVNVYWSGEKNVIALPKIVVGSMGSGKSEYTKNFALSVVKNKDALIYFDFIKNCEASEELSKKIDCIKIDLSKDIDKFALAYPEIQPDESDVWNRLKVANILSRQTEFLINSLSIEPLSARMTRYLDAACKVVYIHRGAKVFDVLNVLTNHIIRMNFIERTLQSGCFVDTDSEVIDLISLNEVDKTGKVTGTNDNKIDGIFDRINIILKDLYLRMMMKAEINYEYDFRKWIDEGKAILIQLPEHTFTNKNIKDTIVTYFMSRIWLSALQRKNPERVCHVITDEIHQAPTCCSLLSSIIVEGRKFGIDFYFTTHYLKQFKTLLDAIKSSGASYMLLAGTEKENFMLLQEEMSPYEVEDVLKLQAFTSLNLINYGNQYVKFISRLPSPII